MNYTWQITNQETGIWEAYWDPTVNPNKPTYFDFAQLSDGLELICTSTAGLYGGQLVKQVVSLPYPSTHIKSSFQVKFGTNLPAFGQVIEFDRKFVTADGWTLDGSFQVLVNPMPADGWMTEINNPWVPTGMKAFMNIDVWNTVGVDYVLDYGNHTISVNGSAPILGKQQGWTPSSIVTQIQLCNNGLAGFYNCKFAQIQIQGV